ncbi:glycoside hydrolase superfamily [Mycena belliarum]|uniref:glucan endo-1,3-beta-D-glucosidase n=1 Tax=Mycena belliarum TaxID=1033014 RepID=A0AAD6TXL1_9AGAR|nr:glycoside hydrolase superfamily [Mycena belliae]
MPTFPCASASDSPAEPGRPLINLSGYWGRLPTLSCEEPSRTVSIDATAPPNCFPALGFHMPSTPPSSINNWWCAYNTEYGFVGFSYEVTACQSASKLKTDFLKIRQTFKGRYIRMYGFCDRTGERYYKISADRLNDIVEAAWNAGIGVHALIWFGFDGTDEWKGRRDALFGILHSNPKAKFVTRVLQFGSEPLFDGVLDPTVLAAQVTAAKANLSSLHIPVTISEMAYGYQEREADGAQDILNAIDLIDAHMLPFFSTRASTASESWPIVLTDLDWFVNNGQGKKIYLSENGWPSVTSEGVQPNSPLADYYLVLDAHCSYFKTVPGGGVGWFWHIYTDDMEPGYGLYDTSGNLKFPFSPKTTC